MGAKILIVDDETSLAEVLAIKIRNEGYEVDTVSSGAEALKALKGNKYGLAIVYLEMSDMDGYEVIRKAKELGVKTKIIACSSIGQAENRERAIDLGAVDYFVKPGSTLADIVNKINRRVDK